MRLSLSNQIRRYFFKCREEMREALKMNEAACNDAVCSMRKYQAEVIHVQTVKKKH